MFYYRDQTPLQRAFYAFHREHGRGAAFFPEIDGPRGHYLRHYRLCREVFRRLHPFSFLRPGQDVVMVGVHDGFIDLGCSTLFLARSIVGPEARMVVVDADPRNIAAVQDYCRRNGIDNVRTVQSGAWHEKTDLKFVFFKDFSSSNMTEAEFKSKTLRWSRERIEAESYSVVVPVDTLDNLLAPFDLRGPVFCNLTINGAEPEALAGARNGLLARGDTVFAFPLRPLDSPMYGLLAERGYRLAVCDAPTKAWEDKQFLYALAAPLEERALLAEGFVPARFRDLPGVSGRFEIVQQDPAAGVARTAAS